VLEFSILGSVEVGQPGRTVKLNGVMQLTLLSALLAGADTLVTVDALTDELWGTTPPGKSVNALQAQISRLRRRLIRLEPERVDSRLETSVAGYRLAVERHELDAWRFLDAVEQVRARSAEPTGGDLSADIARLREALALWRGPAFGGLTGGPLCQTAAGRLREAKNAALSLLYELELRAGGHMRIIPELTELLARNPMQEEFCGLLMIALYRVGRQSDALEIYRGFRMRLVDKLGIDPSPSLHCYEKAILVHDPALMDGELSWMNGPALLSAR
jgi:DNA-binding SARP family transcriptional activator